MALVRPSAARKARLAAVAAAHDAWVMAHADKEPDLPLGTVPAGSVANQHTLDVAGTPEMEADYRARRAR